MPLISVVIPVYNRCRIVRRAIDSVLAQNFSNFELLVVDDGSTDGTAAVVAAIADPRITLLRQERHSGANAARNYGIMKSRAPIICFLDSDDEYLPHKLASVDDIFQQKPDLGALVDSYALVHPEENRGLPQSKINPVIDDSEEFLTLLLNSWTGRRLRKSASAISLRREIAFRAGLFDEQLERRQDIEFLARVARIARCATTDQQLWIKHETADSISAQSKSFIPATLILCRRNPEYLTDRYLRAALARDILRHFHGLVQASKWSEIFDGGRLIKAELGLRQATELIAACIWSLAGGGRPARSTALLQPRRVATAVEAPQFVMAPPKRAEQLSGKNDQVKA